MQDFPIMSNSNRTGRSGVTLLQQYIEHLGWIFRRQAEAETDFGIDAEIEVVNANRVTGRLFKAQIKSSKSLEWKNSETSVQVSTSTYNLWQKLPLLTILFLVDCEKQKVFWTPALANHPRPEAASLSIKFSEDSELDFGGSKNLVRYLASWFSSFDPESFQQEVPYFDRVFKTFDEQVDLYDDWCTMDEDVLNRFQRFYGYMLRLRLHMGLDNQEVPPIEVWYIRNAEIWDGCYREFYWATFSEAMKIITPYYLEAFERLVERLNKVQIDHSNQSVKRYLAEISCGDPMDKNSYCPHPSPGIWLHEEIEARLKSTGGLKYSFFYKQQIRR